jgi:hypothetical protein
MDRSSPSPKSCRGGSSTKEAITVPSGDTLIPALAERRPERPLQGNPGDNLPHSLSLGQRVRIRGGLLRGSEGEVVEQRGPLRSVVTVQLREKVVRVDLPTADIEALWTGHS